MGSRRLLLGAVAVATAVAACSSGDGDALLGVAVDIASEPPANVSGCFDEERVIKVPDGEGGSTRVENTDPEEVPDETETLRNGRARDAITYDLRDIEFLADQDITSSDYNPKPVNLGGESLPRGMCVIAPHVVGQHDRGLGWEELKRDPGGGDHAAIRVGGTGWTLVDGPRVSNMMNGFRPVGDGLLIRNAYLDYIRDDCLENDDLMAVRIEDSLFDGCYTAFSQRPARSSPLWDEPRDDSLLEIDGVLVAMRRMPGGHLIEDSSIETFAHLWKWADVAGPVRITDSVFLVGDSGTEHPRYDWPADVEAEDVLIVWTGSGPYPAEVPDGVTVTADVGVWDEARQTWLDRHGCTDVDDCDPDELVSPAPRRERVWSLDA